MKLTPASDTAKKVLNIGGEGEVPGAINLNALEANLRSVDKIKASGPLVKGDFTNIPSIIPAGSIDEVVGNRLPFMHGEFAEKTVSEAYRVLKPGGRISLHASSGGGEVWVDYLKKAGFTNVEVTAGRAVGVR